MANTTTMLLTSDERRALYDCPVWSNTERNEHFTFHDTEIKVLNSFQKIEDALYFAISLSFFKFKYTLVSFHYQDTTCERQHVMQRYFPNKFTPRQFPKNPEVIRRIENKVLSTVGFKRFREKIVKRTITTLKKQAANYPRQRQLCKALLNHLIQQNIAIPGITTLQDCVTLIWNQQLSACIKSYYRYSRKSERQSVLALLEKTDNRHRIVSIRQDMKRFNTHDIKAELNKHAQLKIVFMIAQRIIPRLHLPTATIDYYAELINYYNGVRLKQLNTNTIQLYLLCYCYSRFLIVNDRLLDAFKKRTLDYLNKANKEASTEAAKFIDEMKAVRQKIYDLLMAIKNDTHKIHMQKSTLFACISEVELPIVADILLNDKLDKTYLFWQHIDNNAHSITLNLRPLFVNLDITIIRNEELKNVVDFMKEALLHNPITKIPQFVLDWIPVEQLPYIVIKQDIKFNRLEFLLYKQLAHHIDTNKLILVYSVKHKEVDDNFIPRSKWKKEKPKLLRALPYPKLRTSPNTLLEEKAHRLKILYAKVNTNIRNGNNPEVLLKDNQDGKVVWRLRPLDKAEDPNDSLFIHFPKRSIVDVLRFAEEKIRFSRAFESILPRSTKQHQDRNLINAVVLANALRMGTHAMSDVCDLNHSALLTAENACVRMETLVSATHLINCATEELPIFKEYDVDGKHHASLDGLKLGTRLQHVLARHSPKFLGRDAGVSGYNVIYNHLSLTSHIISSNEYEGNFTFEMVQHQNVQAFKLERASTDRHGLNPFNFSLFDFTELLFAPRIPKPHHETLWGFGHHADYDRLIITPDKIINKNYIVDDWDNMQRMILSMILGEAIPSVVIGKMSSQKYRSKTKLALTHYNHIVRSEFILNYINDKHFRRTIERVLNRGEAYNNLYRAITLLNGGKFRGQSETEIMIWNQCSRLIAAIIVYYNTYILNHLYVNAKSQEEKDLLLGYSPGAWIHINMLGYYRFRGLESNRFIDELLTRWDWLQSIKKS